MNSPFIMPTYMNMGMNYYNPQYMFQQKPQMGMPYYYYQQNQGNNQNMLKPMLMPMYFPMNINQVNNNNFINFKQQYQKSEKPK